MPYRLDTTGLHPLGDYSRALTLAQTVHATGNSDDKQRAAGARIGFYPVGHGGSRRAWIHRADPGVVYKTLRYGKGDTQQQYGEVWGCQAAKQNPAAAPYVPDVWLWTFPDNNQLAPVLVLEELFPYDPDDRAQRDARETASTLLNGIVADFHGGNWGVTPGGQVKLLDWGQTGTQHQPPDRTGWWAEHAAVSPPPPPPPKVEKPKRARPPRKQRRDEHGRFAAAEVGAAIKPVASAFAELMKQAAAWLPVAPDMTAMAAAQTHAVWAGGATEHVVIRPANADWPGMQPVPPGRWEGVPAAAVYGDAGAKQWQEDRIEIAAAVDEMIRNNGRVTRGKALVQVEPGHQIRIFVRQDGPHWVMEQAELQAVCARLRPQVAPLAEGGFVNAVHPARV